MLPRVANMSSSISRSSEPTLAYWNTRGIAQSIRNLLTYKGIPFQDKRFEYGPAPDFTSSEWLKEKFSHGFAFPNLPYYVDGDVKLTQSFAILRYLGRKFGLAGRTEEETRELDLLENQARDLLVGLALAAYSPGFKEALKNFEVKLAETLKCWANHLHGRKWALGDRLTYVDFEVYEALDWNHEFKPEAFEPYPELLKYLERFENLPNVEEYFASDKYHKWPMTNPKCHWGYKKER